MYQINVTALEEQMALRFNPAMALTLTCLAADILMEQQAWVEISDEEFSRRCGSYFVEGEHVYTVISNRFKSKQLFNGGHKFFIHMKSREGIPLKGWLKRMMYRMRKDWSLTHEDGDYIFKAVNALVRKDAPIIQGAARELPMQQAYMPRAKQFNPYSYGQQA